MGDRQTERENNSSSCLLSNENVSTTKWTENLPSEQMIHDEDSTPQQMNDAITTSNEMKPIGDCPPPPSGRSSGRSSGKSVQIREPAKGSPGSTPIPSQASQKLAESDKLEDQINLQHLVELMRIFHEADENGSDGLDIDEFRAAFGQILGKGKNDQQMAIMFMKIDTNCDGTVDWDEFCTYMLLEYQEKDSMAGEKLPPFPHPLKRIPSPHKDSISRITVLTNVSRGCASGGEESEGNLGKEGNVVTVSKDGMICFWKSNFTLNRTIQLECSKPKLLWVTDMVVMSNVHKILLAFTDSVLAVHDLSMPTFERVFHITALPYCAVTLDYWYDEKDYDHSVLVFGDSDGGICMMEFRRATRCLFGVSASAKQDCVRIAFPELQHHKFEGMKTIYLPKIHCDWVNKVRYWSCMEGVLSCSCDSISSLIITDINGRKESNVFQVWKGIITFDYSREWNIIATGGMDRDLRLWNPYVTTKPTAVLKGHSTAIFHVAIIHMDGHILSFAKDMELRVWSIQDQLCLQTCNKFQQLEHIIPYAFYFHPPTSTLLVGNNHLGALELYREENQKKTDIVSHEYPLCGALYNYNFNQVVSACHGSVVAVWDVDTGEKTIQFSQCHGNVEITAMAFDPSGRRLITGGRDGSIKLWNFNNGACLSILETHYEAEVTCFCFLKQKIVASGWSQVIAEYRDMREADDIIPKYWGDGIHSDDILCMAYQEPDVLVTASYDGDIVLWDMELEQPISILNDSDNQHNSQQYRLFSKLCSNNKKKLDIENSTNKRKTLGSHKTSQSYHPISSKPRYTRSPSKLKERKKDKPKFGYTDNTAIEQVLFLSEREKDTETATLVACGAGGIVQFWNIFGGGLIGEFKVFDSGSRIVSSIEESELNSLHCVTACRAHSNNLTLITGTTLGHIQVWDISEYCINVPSSSRPVCDPPLLMNAWKGHFASVVSIDLAEDKELIVTASTDRCVCLWTIKGRYIGTFGEKQPWKLNHPIVCSNLPRKIPPGLHQVASFNTLQTVAGPSPSKWKLARSLFMILMKKHYLQSSHKPRDSIIPGEYELDDSYINDILGESCKRKTRFRQPIKLQTSESHQLSIYSSLKCPELQEPIFTQSPSGSLYRQCLIGRKKGNSSRTEEEKSFIGMPKNMITEKMLLPQLKNIGCANTN